VGCRTGLYFYEGQGAAVVADEIDFTFDTRDGVVAGDESSSLQAAFDLRDASFERVQREIGLGFVNHERRAEAECCVA